MTEQDLRAQVLPGFCQALPRMTGEEWLTDVTPLVYDIKIFQCDKIVDLRCSGILNIIKIIETSLVKKKILVYGEAGSGKSTTINELFTSWLKRTGLNKFVHAYLINVRNIIAPHASLEHIICHDLRLVPSHQEANVMGSIKFNSSSIIWFLKDYKKKTDYETTIDKLISGKIAPNSAVVVSTRTEDADIISSIMPNKTHEIHVKGFDDSGVREYLKKLPKDWAPSYRHLVVDSGIPRELFKLPFIVAMVCHIHQVGTTDNLVSTSSVLDAVCGTVLNIYLEKSMRDGFIQFTGYRDPRLNKMGVLKQITKLAYHSTKIGKYNFDMQNLYENNMCENTVRSTGIFNFEQSNYSFIHPLFQELCCAHHMACSKVDLKHVLNLLEKPGIMTAKLGVFSNPLLFTVGFEPHVLTLIGHMDTLLSVVRVKQEPDSALSCNHLDLELSYHARLFHECHDSSIRELYLSKLKQYSLPADPVTLSYQPQVQASAYITLVDALGLDGCLNILKSVHIASMTINARQAFLSAPKTTNTRYITDTILISCLPVIDLIQTDQLVIQYCSLAVLAHTTRKWKVRYFLRKAR